MSGTGFVTLVGAGPGDPSLLTMGGREAIAAAEVVLYDRLVGPEILALMPTGALLINVGKNSGHHPIPQHEINRLLLQHAQGGKRVVRLKGGDPYLFGRGAEELELLRENGVPFRVIPGITSAISVPAYGGIPITHRDYASSVHIITGHGKENQPPDINYSALTALNGTLVFLMSVSSMPDICAGLLAAGMPGDTPAAMIENGTSPRQRELVSTLAHLPQKAREAGIASPAILLVGRVCALSEQFKWTQYLPLWGRDILVASSQTTASKLASLLRGDGCRVQEFPCIGMTPLDQPPAFWKNLSSYGWVVLTSLYGASQFFAQLRNNKIDIRQLAGLRFAAIGSETAKVLAAHGILVDYTPEAYNAVALAEGLAGQVQPGEKLLLYRAKVGTPELPRILKEKGVAFEDVAAYETHPQNPDVFGIRQKLLDGGFDAVTFTSASAVKGFAEAMGGADFAALRGVCIGESTAATARELGLSVSVSPEATVASMARLIKEEFGHGTD